MLEKANQSITKAVDYFLERINRICENGPFRKSRRITSAFPLLGLGNNEFYEYAYFERTLEWYVRDLLINTILHDLLDNHGIESLWPDSRNHVRFTTEAIEDLFLYEFIFSYNGEKIAVRYTGLGAGEAADLIEQYKVHKILHIKWDDKLTRRDEQQDAYCVITPAEFFDRYLSSDEYALFLEKVLPAIVAANAEIGFETIPRLSLRYLSNFKADFATFIANTAFEQMRFQVLPGSSEKRPLASMTFSEEDYTTLNKNFQQKKLYKALLGSEGFAKCFITAEYQYQVFKQGHNFDYTSVACGYLKAIEQLLYKLLQINLEHPSQEKLWIKKNGYNIPNHKYIPNVTARSNPKTGKPQVVFDQDFAHYFDTTMMPMIWFVHDNENGWNISNEGRLTVHTFLLNFADECRNDHFHKDNIDDFEVVTRIRNNALLLVYLLIGGYKLTGNLQDDKNALGIIDDSFNRLYRKIQDLPRGISEFIVYYRDQEPLKAYRHFVQEPTVYDDMGAVSASKTRFVAVDEFSHDEYDQAMQGKYPAKEFYLSADNIPEKISYINGRHEEVFIVW